MDSIAVGLKVKDSGMSPRVRKILNPSQLSAGCFAHFKTQFSLKHIQFAGETGSEDQETNEKLRIKKTQSHYSRILYLQILLLAKIYL